MRLWQVGSVSAVDKDGEEFNAFTYSFQSGEKITEWFKIDQDTGVLTTTKPLDREVKGTHRPPVRDRRVIIGHSRSRGVRVP